MAFCIASSWVGGYFEGKKEKKLFENTTLYTTYYQSKYVHIHLCVYCIQDKSREWLSGSIPASPSTSSRLVAGHVNNMYFDELFSELTFIKHGRTDGQISL